MRGSSCTKANPSSFSVACPRTSSWRYPAPWQHRTTGFYNINNGKNHFLSNKSLRLRTNSVGISRHRPQSQSTQVRLRVVRIRAVSLSFALWLSLVILKPCIPETQTAFYTLRHQPDRRTRCPVPIYSAWNAPGHGGSNDEVKRRGGIWNESEGMHEKVMARCEWKWFESISGLIPEWIRISPLRAVSWVQRGRERLETRCWSRSLRNIRVSWPVRTKTRQRRLLQSISEISQG